MSQEKTKEVEIPKDEFILPVSKYLTLAGLISDDEMDHDMNVDPVGVVNENEDDYNADTNPASKNINKETSLDPIQIYDHNIFNSNIHSDKT